MYIKVSEMQKKTSFYFHRLIKESPNLVRSNTKIMRLEAIDQNLTKMIKIDLNDLLVLV